MKKVIAMLLILLTILETGCGFTKAKNDGEEVTEAKEETKVEEKTEEKPEVEEDQDGEEVVLPALDMEKSVEAKCKPYVLENSVTSKGELPVFSPTMTSPFQIDLRCADLSNFDLSDKTTELLNADFDTKTVWPEKLPEDFEPENIMELGRNPGLGIRNLQGEGITGEGVAIGIIDGPLLGDHIEYKDNLKYYEEITGPFDQAEPHGAAVASIAVGQDVGVAPGADLYYIAADPGVYVDGELKTDFSYMAAAIDRFVEINRNLPQEKRIRVISISSGWDKKDKGYKTIMEAVKNANEEGIFVISSSLEQTNKFEFGGLGRDPMSDPDDVSVYRPGRFMIDQFANFDIVQKNKILFAPMDCRTTASQAGPEEYVFYSTNGWSWVIPYLTGTYALACQVNPDITYEEFWKAALETADEVAYDYNGREYTIPKVLSPEKLMEEIK